MSVAFDISMTIFARVSNIAVANGFATDIGLQVFRGKRRLDESAMPCAILIEGDDHANSNVLRSANLDQKYVVEGHSVCDPNHPNDMAHAMIADIKKALFSDPKFMPGTVRSIEYLGRHIVPRDDGLNSVAAGISFRVNYVEDLSNP